ncbi:hypothetical protein RR46_08101 [Papilio xuthus]|uniref:Uncharacterized protein n=1 Tax=Papilio xuthus TaxID=66420 RepID=A0A194QA53_PAPXU|nr:hypothetical protein RR46_08101 [Papilio xuthus]
MPDRESVGPGTTGSGGFLPLQFPSAFAAFHATTPPSAQASAMHHATHYHHHAHGTVRFNERVARRTQRVRDVWRRGRLPACPHEMINVRSRAPGPLPPRLVNTQ